jgi:hypothetical protein
MTAHALSVSSEARMDWLRMAGLLSQYPISESTVRRWVRTGLLEKHQVGGVVLYRRDDVERLIGRP